MGFEVCSSLPLHLVFFFVFFEIPVHLIIAREKERRLYAKRPLILFYCSPVRPDTLLDTKFFKCHLT